MFRPGSLHRFLQRGRVSSGKQVLRGRLFFRMCLIYVAFPSMMIDDKVWYGDILFSTENPGFECRVLRLLSVNQEALRESVVWDRGFVRKDEASTVDSKLGTGHDWTWPQVLSRTKPPSWRWSSQRTEGVLHAFLCPEFRADCMVRAEDMSCLRAEPEGCAALKDCTAPNSRHDEIRDRPYVAGSFQLSQQQRWQRERGRLWSAGDQSPAVGLPSSMRCHRWTMSHVSGVAEGSATLAACPCASPLTTCFVERARTPHRLMNILQQTKPANDVSLHCQLDRCAPVIGSCLRKLHGIRHLRNSVLRGHE